jgi:nitrite reductase/ring-hydroxylating ferredoxin subunit
MQNTNHNSSRREFVAGTLAAGCGFCLTCGSGHDALARVQLKTGPLDVGSTADYAGDGIFDKFAAEQVMIVREGKRLYACSAICTHKERTLKVVQDQLRCPSHGSRFDAEGKVVKGPAKKELSRFGISADAAGKLTVDRSKRFDSSHWDDEGSFVAVG